MGAPEYTVRPISDRTPFHGDHENSPFRVTWSTALDVLDLELFNLDAKNVVIEVDVPERGIRLDGRLRADARAVSPAVRLAFDSREGPLVYATDRFVRPSWRSGGMAADWQHNVYAIALGLQALCKVDRYGITERGEQYAGWKAIEATPSGMGRDAAMAVLDGYAGGVWNLAAEGRSVYRRARALAHPDRHGGDRTGWDLVEQAGRVLGLDQ